MSRFDTLPAEPPESCFEIAATATNHLSRLASGNGLDQGQIRLSKHDTNVYALHGTVSVTLKPEVTERIAATAPVAGRMLPARDSVFTEIEAHAVALPQDSTVAATIFDAILLRPDKGWGLDTLKIPLKAAHIFSVTENCITCSGVGLLICKNCQGLGEMPCNACQGQGFNACTFCFGSGLLQKSDGSRAPCPHCNNSGRMPCQICREQRTLPCSTCQGEKRTPCLQCQRSGKMVRIFQVVWHAEAGFNLDRSGVPPEAVPALDLIGVQNLILQKQADVYCTDAVAEGNRITLSYTAFLPLAKAELQIAGKIVTAEIAGLQAKIVSIEPFLDKYIKPGILALQKVSKGSFATEPLIATACKYKVLRQIISGLGHQKKKAVYQKTVREYPLMLSDKYVRVSVTFAAQALLALTRTPRLQGLAAGSVLSGLIAACWFMTPARGLVFSFLQSRAFGQHILLADILVWAAGYILCIYLIRLMAARALRLISPLLQADGKEQSGLPSAGAEGYWALVSTFALWFTVAAFAPEKAGWMSALLKSSGLVLQ